MLGTATGQPIQAQISLNRMEAVDSAGADVVADQVTVSGNTLYKLIDQKTVRPGVIEIKAETPGL